MAVYNGETTHQLGGYRCYRATPWTHPHLTKSGNKSPAKSRTKSHHRMILSVCHAGQSKWALGPGASTHQHRNNLYAVKTGTLRRALHLGDGCKPESCTIHLSMKSWSMGIRHDEFLRLGKNLVPFTLRESHPHPQTLKPPSAGARGHP